MLTDKTYLGIMRAAINVKTGEPDTDWRLSHVGQKGLIVAQPDDEPGKYVVYLFMKNYNYFHFTKTWMRSAKRWGTAMRKTPTWI